MEDFIDKFEGLIMLHENSINVYSNWVPRKYILEEKRMIDMTKGKFFFAWPLSVQWRTQIFTDRAK